MMFKIGDLIKILIHPMKGDFGIIVQHKNDMSTSALEWLVHLVDGRDLWFRGDEIADVYVKDDNPI